MGKRVPVRTKTKLRQAADEHMAMLENNPQRVMGGVSEFLCVRPIELHPFGEAG